MAPAKEIKPKVYQLNPEQTLFLGGLARFDFIQGERSSFIAYVANDVIHRTKLTKADEFYEKHVHGLLQPPRADEVADFPLFNFQSKKKTISFLLDLAGSRSPNVCHRWVGAKGCRCA